MNLHENIEKKIWRDSQTHKYFCELKEKNWPSSSVVMWGETSIEAEVKAFDILQKIKEKQVEVNPVMVLPDLLSKKEIKDKIYNLLKARYNCSRDWSAWQYGTMTQNDFSPLEEDTDLIEDFYNLLLEQRTLAETKGFLKGYEEGEKFANKINTVMPQLDKMQKTAQKIIDELKKST